MSPRTQRRLTSQGSPGFVSLVGSGPGDPDLITLKGVRRLREADLIVHDRLIPHRLLAERRIGARLIDVGKAPGRHGFSQTQINALLVAQARRGLQVVRLKGGDPFVFGRGGEEAEVLDAEGIPFEIVPGISSSIAAPAYAGIPVTHRAQTGAFAVVTGHDLDSPDTDWGALSRVGTLVVLMGLGRLGALSRRLIGHGLQAETPAAVISRACTAGQRVARSTLRGIEQAAQDLPTPATVVIGRTVDYAERLDWFRPEETPGAELAATVNPGTIAGAAS
ncbi:hypothetical protein ABI59_21845 [Acidobacteria bacterium Mor1]|nr:hypothetical protein ABI59_21845 [Acidobacteria bacterium Mor1]